MPLKLKLGLWFNKPLLFRGFLPEAEVDFLRLRLRDDREIALYLSDRQAQLSPFDVVPIDPEDLKKHTGTINCLGLTMEVDVPGLGPDAVDEQPSEESDKLVQETLDLALKVHNGLVEYLRNAEKQYWLQPIVSGSYDHTHFLANTDVYWLDDNDNWHEFPKPNHITGYPLETTISGPDVTLNQDTAINQSKWNCHAPAFLKRFIEQGKKAKTVDALIANAYCHLEQLNTSLAVIEAVRALEQFVKSRLPKAVYHLVQDREPDLEEKEIDKLFQKAGLTAVTLLVFGLLGQGMGLESEDIERIQEAVNTRNDILHFGRESVEFSQANEYLSAIHRAINVLSEVA